MSREAMNSPSHGDWWALIPDLRFPSCEVGLNTSIDLGCLEA